MAIELEGLIVELRARDEQLLATLKSVESRLSTFETKINSVTSRIEGGFRSLQSTVGRVQQAFAALGSLAALGGLTRLTKDALDSASALVDTADRIGVNVEALQELQFAATQSGASVDTFNNFMQAFSRRLSEAAAGTGTAVDVLKVFKLNAEDLAKDPARAVTLIADKIGQLGTQAEKLDAISKLSNRGSAAILNMLQVGGPALDALRQKARDLGIVLDEELARKSEELGDQFDAATQVISNQFRTALLELAPILIKTAGLIASAAKEIVNLSQVAGLLDSSLAQQMSRVNKQITDTQEHIARLQSQKAAGSDNFVSRLFGSTDKDIAFQQTRLAELQESLAKLQGQVQTLGPAVKDTTGELHLMTEAEKDATDKATKAAETLAKQRADLLQQIAIKREHLAIQEQVAAGTITEEEGLKRMALASAVGAKGTQDLVTALALLGVEYESNAQIQEKLLAITKELKDAEEERLKQVEQMKQKVAEQVQGIEEQVEANTEQARIIQEGIANGRKYDDVLRDVAIRQQELANISAGLGDKSRGLAEALVLSGEAAKKSSADLDAYNNNVENAALSTADLKNVVHGLIEGEKFGEVFKNLGQTMGQRLIDGVIFGKGQKEKGILDNFNTLLGIDAAGLFGAQGVNLGNTLIGGMTQSVTSGASSLLKGAGVNLGSLFGSSAADAASVTWEQAAPGMFEAGGAPMASAQTGGSMLGTVFGAAMAGAAGISLGKGLNSMLGVGGSKSGKLGSTIGGTVGAVGGGIAGFMIGGPMGASIGSALGGAVGSIFGGFIGDLFASTPSRGTEIRKGVKKFLKEIEVSFAREIDAGDYFFEETKKLAKRMFGDDFLAASKQVLQDAGGDLSNQLQALGVFLTEKQRRDLGKSVEQTGVTFGNMLLDNLGLDPEKIDGAIKEIVQKAGITFPALVQKLTNIFQDGAIGMEFYTDSVQGAVDIFFGDLPDAINASAIALKSFTEEGIFDLEAFQAEVQKATDTFDLVTNSFIDVVKNSKAGEDIGALLGQQIMTGLEDMAVDAFLKEFIEKTLFEGVDLSDGLDAAELGLITSRAIEARTSVDQLRTAFTEAGDEVEGVTDKVEDLYNKIRDLTQQRFQLRLDVIGDLAAIGAISSIDAARARIGANSATVSRFANPNGLGARISDFVSDEELEQARQAVADTRQAVVELFQAQEQAAQDALAKRIQDINEEYNARRNALQQEAQAIQDASEARLEALAEEREDTQALFQARLDGLQEELQIAQDFRQVAESIQDTIDSLVASTSRFSGPEQLALAQRQAAALREQIAGASGSERARLIQELSEVLSGELQTAQGTLGQGAFNGLFDSVVLELEALRDQTIEEGDRTEELQQAIAQTTAQMNVALESIDAQMKQAQEEAKQAQRNLQSQMDQLSLDEQAAVAEAQAATDAEISALRLEAVKEIQALAVIEDEILAEQIKRAAEAVELTADQLTVLKNIETGINTLTGQIGSFLTTASQGATAEDREARGQTESTGSTSFTFNPSISFTVSGNISEYDAQTFGKQVASAVLYEWQYGQMGREIRQEINRS